MILICISDGRSSTRDAIIDAATYVGIKHHGWHDIGMASTACTFWLTPINAAVAIFSSHTFPVYFRMRPVAHFLSTTVRQIKTRVFSGPPLFSHFFLSFTVYLSETVIHLWTTGAMLVRLQLNDIQEDKTANQLGSSWFGPSKKILKLSRLTFALSRFLK